MAYPSGISSPQGIRQEPPQTLRCPRLKRTNVPDALQPNVFRLYYLQLRWRIGHGSEQRGGASARHGFVVGKAESVNREARSLQTG
jgi:hypothetical protein